MAARTPARRDAFAAGGVPPAERGREREGEIAPADVQMMSRIDTHGGGKHMPDAAAAPQKSAMA